MLNGATINFVKNTAYALDICCCMWHAFVFIFSLLPKAPHGQAQFVVKFYLVGIATHETPIVLITQN